MADNTPSAAETLASLYPQDFAAALRQMEVEDAEYATPAQKELAASHVMRLHAPELFDQAHRKAITDAGLGLDPQAAPESWLKRAADREIGNREILEFVSREYGDVGEGMAEFQADLAKMKKAEQERAAMDPRKRAFGNPF